MAMASGLRVLVVDDHDGFRRRARSMLRAAGWDVIGEASSGNEALGMIRELRPDVVVLDVMLGDISGFEVAAQLDGQPSPRIILTSAYDAATFARDLAQTSAAGFVPKTEFTSQRLLAVLSDAAM